VLTFDPKLYINGDNVDYMNLARGVRQGHLWSSGKYPPLFPMMLAPVQALFGMRLLPQKILVTFFAGGAIWLLAGVVRRRTDGRSGPWLLFVAATLIPFVEYTHYVMSEVPFLFLLLAAVTACDRLQDRPAGPHADRGLLMLALWIAAAFYTRTAGVALAVGVLFWLVLSRRPKHALVLTGLLVVAAVPWFLHLVTTKGGNPYLQQLTRVNPYYPELGTLTVAGWAQRLGVNARTYLLGLVPIAVMPARYGSTYSPPQLQKLHYPLWIAIPLLVPFAAGLWRGLRGSPARRVAGVPRAGIAADPVTCVTLTSLLLLCLWPAIWASNRFLVPIVPLLLVIWWGGWYMLEEIGLRCRLGRVRAVVLVLLLFLGVRNLVLYVRETRAYPPEWGNYFSALEWIRENTPKDAVIIDRKPGFAEFTAHRKAITFPQERDPVLMMEFFERVGVTHVVAPSLPYEDIARFLLPTILKERSCFRMVYQTSTPPSYVLEFHPEGAAGLAAPGTR
jgi:4-amino-4-deoxy-L-arabinose transferase-like glycosyltransferase